ncbi:MAG: dihydroorotate dehydrogenase electron transfer subunit [Deltaproteobacteria bacterium]|nr:dihydroorotate dehydrogenase electron transfer subunit [Deltaproteobacteria bacterium]
MSEAVVAHNRLIAPGYYRMGLQWKSPGVTPGQFIMLRVSADSLDPLLRRPFGVYDVLRGAKGIEILYRVVGRGTKIMSTLRPGDMADIFGPLGNGFPAVKDPGRAVMVAGGMGIAPFYMLAKDILKRGENAALFYGARGRTDAAIATDFRKLKGLKVEVATEDGSMGEKGLVTDIFGKKAVWLAGEASVVYACGPSGMLKEVARISKKNGLRCFVSLERAMACGIGVCLGCAVRTGKTAGKGTDRKKYGMVCSDGPVFPGEDIEWESL